MIYLIDIFIRIDNFVRIDTFMTPGYESLIDVVVPCSVPLTILVITFENQRVFVIGIEESLALFRSKGGESIPIFVK